MMRRRAFTGQLGPGAGQAAERILQGFPGLKTDQCNSVDVAQSIMTARTLAKTADGNS
jgi:hypothetical protein